VGGGTLNYDKPQKVYLNFRNNLITLMKYLPADDVVMVLFIRWILDGLAGLKYVLRGQFGNMFAIVRAHFYIYSHLRMILQKRKNAGLLYKRKPLPYMTGVYPGSILIDYYMRWKRRYSDLFNS
ncbi:MAG: bifunctional riboflavin kinase/FAD synthetase, partial [Saprospiraceae bacterium]